MKQWTRTRRTSFIIHVAFVSVPFLASSISALLFWQSLFGDWLLAIPAVLVIDVLALTGLVLFIAGIPSPFVPLRRALPFVSIVPLGRELYLLLAHNSAWVAMPVTVLSVTVLTAIAWKCFATIEALFIDPVAAAREKAREQLTVLSVEMAQLTEKNAVVSDFVAAWQRQTVTATLKEERPAPALPQEQETPRDFTLEELFPELAEAIQPPAFLADASKSARVRALAQARGVHESTAWRKVRSGEWSVEE